MTAADAETNPPQGVFTLQISKSDLHVLFVDLLSLKYHERSPLSKMLGAYKAGSAEASKELISFFENTAVSAKIANILAQPTLIMDNRMGGGSTPLSYFTACHSASIDEESFFVISPSFEGAYLIQMFDTPWHFLAWWLDDNACPESETVANYIPPPTSLESFIYILHSIDMYRRSAYESQLENKPANTTPISASDFIQTLQTSSQSGDIRWLLPTFLSIIPGLDLSGFEHGSKHLIALSRLNFMLPSTSNNDADSHLIFGEAAKVMGAEFYQSWFKSIGFELSVYSGNEWQTSSQGFLAPTGVSNHLALIELDNNGTSHINHQTVTRDTLEYKIIKILKDALDIESSEAVVPVSIVSSSEKLETIGKTVCVACGAGIDIDDTFCKSCGGKTTTSTQKTSVTGKTTSIISILQIITMSFILSLIAAFLEMESYTSWLICLAGISTVTGASAGLYIRKKQLFLSKRMFHTFSVFFFATLSGFIASELIYLWSTDFLFYITDNSAAFIRYWFAPTVVSSIGVGVLASWIPGLGKRHDLK